MAPLSPTTRLSGWVGVNLVIAGACLATTPSFLFATAGGLPSKLACTLGLLGWSVLAATVIATLRLALRLAGSPSSRTGRTLVSVVFHTAVYAALFLWSLSWMAFHRTGSFLTYEMLEFFAADPRHVLALTTGTERSALLLALAAAGALLALLIASTGSRRKALLEAEPRLRSSIVLKLALAIPIVGVALVAYPALALPGAELESFVSRLCYRSTPGFAMLCSYSVRADTEHVDDVVLEPIRSDGQYLAEIPTARPGPVNVVLVVVESLRRDCLQVLDADREYMPFLDSRVGTSLVFSNAYAQSNATDYAVPALLSSLYPFKRPHPQRFTAVEYPKVMLYDVLSQLGYRTAIFSSGNEKWVDTDVYLQTEFLDEFFHAALYDGETVLSPEDTGLWNNIKHGLLQKGSLDDAVTVKLLLDWIRDGSPERPFFAYLNLQTTHFPYQQAFEIERVFTPDEIDFQTSFYTYPRDKTQVMRNRYGNSMRYVDDRLRELIEALDEDGSTSLPTLFVITGDHGESFFEHGKVTHAQEMHEEALRIPLLFLGPPALVPHRLDDRPVQQVDIAPTILGMLGVPPHPAWQGADVLHPKHDPAGHKLFLTTQSMMHQNVLIWRGHKYTLDRRGDDRFIDLRTDPGEAHDLRTVSPEMAELYADELRRWTSLQLSYYGQAEYYEHYYAPKYDP